jgi:GT2 family glycosyltransferase
MAGVEPGVASIPRVHRFAQPPVLGDPGMVAAPPAVWIEVTDDDHAEEAVARTRAALDRSNIGPAAVLEGSLDRALAETRADWVLLVRAGDEPSPLALARFGQATVLAPDAAVITCDDDVRSSKGSRREPRFRPGPSPDRWLATDDSGPLLLVDRVAAQPHAAWLSEEGLAAGPAWRHALALLLAGRGGERHAHVPMLLCHRVPASAAATPPLSASEVQTILRRWEPGAVVEHEGPVRRARRQLVAEPSVEVVVCLRDRAELLERCVDSLFARTAYERLDLAIVDNGSVHPETFALLAKLARRPGVRVLRDGRPFNFAALNNLAAASSNDDVLVFLNNDTEALDSDWVQKLLEEALRPEVGAVAPLLLYNDGSIQHAGAAIGLHGYAGHPFAGLRPGQETPFGAAAAGTRNWLAVTAACMVVERWKFEAVGGFDESFVVAGNDVDLCLRLTAEGHRSLCVPHAALIHAESTSRGTYIDPGDFVRSELSYGRFRTVGDPFYNPNLTLRATDCRVRVPGEEP